MFTMYHHSTPVPSRTHKKSSTGCKACKLRKVKCDEKKPVCGKCAVHFSNLESCDYGCPPRNTKKTAVRTSPNQQIDLPSHCQEGSTSKSKYSTLSDSPCQSFSVNLSDEKRVNASKKERLLAQNDESTIITYVGPTCCKCPCHQPEYTDMLSDALFGICRICGNFPYLATSTSHCVPIVSSRDLIASSIDPFSILPVKPSPGVHALMYHWVNTLSLFPTKIHSKYCTNPTWLSAAIANPALFNVTLYVTSLHKAGLNALRETPESMFYKLQTVECLNKCLQDSKNAVSDETIAAVLLLLFVVCVTGEKHEVEAHIRGLRQMIKLRGGIHHFAIDGVFLHMLCTTNHLTAVLDESLSLHPPIDSLYVPKHCTLSLCNETDVRKSNLWKPFALKIGFHNTVVEIFHEMGYLFSVVDAFTLRLLPNFRGDFHDLAEKLGRGS